MTLLVSISLLSLIAGFFLPLRWGIWGFIGAAFSMFTLFAGTNTAMGFEGTSLEESLLLFNGSWVSYVGFNLQITYRAFVLPLLCITLPFLFRLSRANRTRG